MNFKTITTLNVLSTCRSSDPVFLPVIVCLLIALAMHSQKVNANRCPCDNDQPVFGIFESAKLVNIDNLIIEALIDTGATTTAMDAKNIRMHVNRQGKRWVYYDFIHKETGETISMRQPVARVARILTHKGPPTERPVVMNTIAIKGVFKFIEVSLINRSNFPQQLLIGRNFLKGAALVDSNQ
ncbi:hypothetical protein ACH42_07285 [Endozoicomonas sp. (ex Bugula neritina AB1)]|nr:hypothetical protein ACH42_07285 [Endozoicomonas sp. (ex Bugula neritina AB1)]